MIYALSYPQQCYASGAASKQLKQIIRIYHCSESYRYPNPNWREVNQLAQVCTGGRGSGLGAAAKQIHLVVRVKLEARRADHSGGCASYNFLLRKKMFS